MNRAATRILVAEYYVKTTMVGWLCCRREDKLEERVADISSTREHMKIGRLDCVSTHTDVAGDLESKHVVQQLFFGARFVPEFTLETDITVR